MALQEHGPVVPHFLLSSVGFLNYTWKYFVKMIHLRSIRLVGRVDDPVLLINPLIPAAPKQPFQLPQSFICIYLYVSKWRVYTLFHLTSPFNLVLSEDDSLTLFTHSCQLSPPHNFLLHQFSGLTFLRMCGQYSQPSHGKNDDFISFLKQSLNLPVLAIALYFHLHISLCSCR